MKSVWNTLHQSTLEQGSLLSAGSSSHGSLFGHFDRLSRRTDASVHAVVDRGNCEREHSAWLNATELCHSARRFLLVAYQIYSAGIEGDSGSPQNDRESGLDPVPRDSARWDPKDRVRS